MDRKNLAPSAQEPGVGRAQVLGPHLLLQVSPESPFTFLQLPLQRSALLHLAVMLALQYF